MLTSAIGGAKLFRILLTKFTEPEEVVGPYDPKLLREGRYVRVWKDKLPDADIVYLDEVYKASPAIRNYLLDIILYRRFYDGEKYIPTRTKAIYMSANETPRLVEDQAFFDRSAVRLFSQHLSWDEVIDVLSTPIAEELPKIIDVSELEEAQKEVSEVERGIASDAKLLSAIRDIAKGFKDVSGDVEVSERRLVMVRGVASVVSFIYGEPPSIDHVAIASVYSLPSSWDTFTSVLSVVNKLYPDSSIAFIDKIRTVRTELTNAKTEEERRALQAKLEDLMKTAPKRFFLLSRFPH